ncbi:MAG TPA: nucleotidyl transferase AbiEii/AbiGii toxin family protein [Thermoanaerobaculia bacterium]|nr:nucleotidyl transferase AbiEii/AbiGii toxin family protein [Thermoanaerobaculia bacterium]
MTRLLAALLRATRDLRDLGQRWALVGGLAVSARAEPRTTRDVDLVVAVSGDSQAEKLVRNLRARGYTLVEHLEQDAAGRLATVRFIAPGEDEGGVLVDLLFASSGVEPEIVAQAEELEIAAGIALPIATTGHLIALKLLARDDRLRPQDFDDLKALLREANPADIGQAREALQLIIARGYNRGRDDLLEQLEQLVAKGAPQ